MALATIIAAFITAAGAIFAAAYAGALPGGKGNGLTQIVRGENSNENVNVNKNESSNNNSNNNSNDNSNNSNNGNDNSENGENGNENQKDALTKPGSPKISNASCNSVDLAWDAVDGATSYEIFQDGSSIAKSEVASHTVGELEPGTTHEFSITALDTSSGELRKSGPSDATSAETKPVEECSDLSGS
ncbi:fibronectin type III domain-containing protein [Streptomyces dioscori]|uniref:fibronectin type III domain-containing protein n=1 Tax=Streptomyces dioscori TaxID=2109333 RepID=UPI00131E94E0|nr:fibronectin type III domain-containing protein [Streptomyces dioscori]